jgi:hypothetical protein
VQGYRGASAPPASPPFPSRALGKQKGKSGKAKGFDINACPMFAFCHRCSFDPRFQKEPKLVGDNINKSKRLNTSPKTFPPGSGRGGGKFQIQKPEGKCWFLLSRFLH